MSENATRLEIVSNNSDEYAVCRRRYLLIAWVGGVLGHKTLVSAHSGPIVDIALFWTQLAFIEDNNDRRVGSVSALLTSNKKVRQATTKSQQFREEELIWRPWVRFVSDLVR